MPLVKMDKFCKSFLNRIITQAQQPLYLLGQQDTVPTFDSPVVLYGLGQDFIYLNYYKYCLVLKYLTDFEIYGNGPNKPISFWKDGEPLAVIMPQLPK